MSFNPACFINVILAFTAIFLYFTGSYRFYKDKEGYITLLGLAIAIDVITATLASFKLTPTVEIQDVAAVPWYSLLFKVHVTLSMVGFTGFIALFLYLLVNKRNGYSFKIRTWQFKILLPIWIVGESIALINALSKICFRFRIFEVF
jgi:hypothetical protein